MRTFGKLGQGATEYLVLLAVVLIIALVSISLLGFFPGTAEDSKLAQSKIYWSSTSPIAVVEGFGYESYNGEDNNGIKLVLKNNGGKTIELMGIAQPKSDAIASDIAGNKWQRLYGEYTVYLAPPRGTGIGYYTSPIFLAPGETITVGMSTYAYPTGNGYPTRVCRNLDSGETGKYMELPNVGFYYAVTSDGQRVELKQQGSKPLIVPCVPGDLN